MPIGKYLINYQEVDLHYNNKIQITDDWFFDQLKPSLNINDFENFFHKNITVEDLLKDATSYSKSMFFRDPKLKFYDCTLAYITGVIHAIVELYNKFGRFMYGYEKESLIKDIKILAKDGCSNQTKDALQKLPNFKTFKAVMNVYKMDENCHGVPPYMGIDGYFKFVIEDEKEGMKALKTDWRSFKLWMLYRRLEKQGKIPVYKDKEIEDALWFDRFRSDWVYDDLDKVKTITPMDENVARNIARGIGYHNSILLAFHVHGVFETATKHCVPESLKGKVPKRVLTELFRNGLQLDAYIRNTIRLITDSYEKPTWWDMRHFRIPTTWHDWILIEWLFQKMKTSFRSMVKTRFYYIHAIKVEYTYFSKLDEIQPEDLTSGIKTSPFTAFMNSEARIRKIRMEENIELPVAPFKETENVKQIKRSFDFIEEGEAMDNCVAGYIDSAIDEECYIYHVYGKDYTHGTMEVNNDGEIVQLYGPHNENPSTEVIYAIAEWLGINGLTVPEVIMDWRSNMKKDQRTHFDDVYNVNKMHYEDKVKA